MGSCRDQDAATGYKPGIYACLTAALLNIVIVGILTVLFIFENKKADKGEKELEVSDVSAGAMFYFLVPCVVSFLPSLTTLVHRRMISAASDIPCKVEDWLRNESRNRWDTRNSSVGTLTDIWLRDWGDVMTKE